MYWPLSSKNFQLEGRVSASDDDGELVNRMKRSCSAVDFVCIALWPPCPVLCDLNAGHEDHKAAHTKITKTFVGGKFNTFEEKKYYVEGRISGTHDKIH
jgi:hypothetical protein